MLNYLDNWSKGKWFVGSKFRKYLRKIKIVQCEMCWSKIKEPTTIKFCIVSSTVIEGRKRNMYGTFFAYIQETYLSVKLNPRVLVGTHEFRITPRILSDSCLNSLDPKLRPLTSFSAAVTISVLPRLLQATNCHSKAIFWTTSKPKI